MLFANTGISTPCKKFIITPLSKIKFFKYRKKRAGFRLFLLLSCIFKSLYGKTVLKQTQKL